mmetsp:Transcript_12446/g.30585  ORF Transcript_12446/g.30585 Transcript_12446/m.30585 type:complete len:202 (+) Transcript_12446:529-1134(+)
MAGAGRALESILLRQHLLPALKPRALQAREQLLQVGQPALLQLREHQLAVGVNLKRVGLRQRTVHHVAHKPHAHGPAHFVGRDVGGVPWRGGHAHELKRLVTQQDDAHCAHLRSPQHARRLLLPGRDGVLCAYDFHARVALLHNAHHLVESPTIRSAGAHGNVDLCRRPHTDPFVNVHLCHRTLLAAGSQEAFEVPKEQEA